MSDGGLRALVLTAPVGAGHDVAAYRVAHEIIAAGGQAEVVDGLGLVGPRLERLIVTTYRFQLRRAAWSWRLLYALSRNRLVIRAVGRLLAWRGGARLVDACTSSRATIVVSVYPLLSAALAEMRRRGQLELPCASVITDFDPHPGWIHPGLDANLSFVAGSSEGVRPAEFTLACRPTADVRRGIGADADERLALVVGGAWGIGNLAGAARVIADIPGLRAVVVTGRNHDLRRRLERDGQLDTAIVLGYRSDLLELIASCDVVIQHAGGMTCLEAFALGVPVVMFDPLPGHGRANARAMAAAEMATIARRGRDLKRLLGSADWWHTDAPVSARRALTLFDRPHMAARLATLAGAALAPRSNAPSPWRPAQQLALAVFVVVVLVLISEGARDAVSSAARALPT